MSTNEVSIKKGFQTRSEYLQSLAERFKFSIVFVTELADAYDESEDFDGLIAALSIYSDENEMIDEIDEMLDKKFDQLLDEEGQKNIHDMVQNCIKQESKEAAIIIRAKNINIDIPWLLSTYADNFIGERVRNYDEVCIVCNHTLGEHSHPSYFCPNVDK